MKGLLIATAAAVALAGAAGAAEIDDALFAAWLEKAKAALGVDDATAAAILKAAEE